MERTGRITVGLLLAVPLAVAGCSGSRTATWRGPGGGASTGPSRDSLAAAVTSPVDNAVGVPTSGEIVYTATKATSTRVELTDASGARVNGALRADGSSWVPESQLDYSTRYAATVTATGSDGHAETSTVTFTTMARPSKLISMHSWIGDNQVVGVGALMVLTFGAPVPQNRRAAVQKRLFMRSTPEQEGTWNWFSATEVHYRPKVYWQPGTKLALRALFGGVPLGNGAYGRADITVNSSVTTSPVIVTADDHSKKVTVTKDGRVIRTMNASFGKASTPSSSGNMVIMTMAKQEIFDSATSGIPKGSPGYYYETVYYSLRLTWGGQYIHAAPWSTGAQGRYDVSHGCTNLSTSDASWLYTQVHVGDPVIVKNTPRGLTWGDGWTDWNVSWDQYQKGSAQ